MKPNYQQAREITRIAQALDKQMSGMTNDRKREIAHLQRVAGTFFEQRLRTALESMEVEILAQGKQGIRVASLRQAGIENIYQLSQMSVRRLETLEGIGMQSAEKIRYLTAQIVENTRKKLPVRINADAPSPEDDQLIKALYVLVIRNPIRRECKGIYRAHHKGVQEELQTAKPACSVLRWVFTSPSHREAALQAVESLDKRLSGPFGNVQRMEIYRAAATAGMPLCREHFRSNAAAYYAALGEFCKDLNTEQLTPMGISRELLDQIESRYVDLKYVTATLRPYQLFGVKYALYQKKSLLGDEMGLGKTIQAIAAMAALKAEGKRYFMVVCPASVLINWCREIGKHSTLSVTKIHGADEEGVQTWLELGDVAVTTYESISRFSLPEDFLFDMLVVDEAHYVKNPGAQRTAAMLKLLPKAEYALYMTGTPLVNRVDEMCFLVNCLQPELSKKLDRVKNLSTAEQFRLELAPVYLRRVRGDVLRELPDLIEKEQWCDLNAEEEKAYWDAVDSGNLMAIRQVSWQVEDLAESTKAARLLEICETAEEEGRKVIVFSFFRRTLAKVAAMLGDRSMTPITGDTSPALRQQIVDAFNSAQPGTVLISQVQAGGTGLNIQAASVVVFCEPQLTPAMENQAISRAYRMGQTRDVLVHRLLAVDTIDERILELLSGKQEAFDNFADDSVVGNTQLQRQKAEESSWITRMIQEEQKRLAEKKQ